MSRVYWDTMLFIYLIENHPVHRDRVEKLLFRARRRGDTLFTSYLGLGEVLAGAEKYPERQKGQLLRQTLDDMGFSYLPFDEGAVATFSQLRARQKVKVADSIHLACAASAGIDLFLTGDLQLTKLDVPGIQFIADFNDSLF